MKIFIGCDSSDLTGKISKRFGHANYYLIYDTDSKKSEILVNSEHDEKHEFLLNAINDGVELFIVGNIGPHAFGIINTGNTKVYLARKMTATEALEKFEKNELELLSEPTVKKSMHKN
jgi:predicted Fe-Mo cluster-binding NifX family protein